MGIGHDYVEKSRGEYVKLTNNPKSITVTMAVEKYISINEVIYYEDHRGNQQQPRSAGVV